jgi:predicted phage terminase large subunit-like protein
MTREADLIAIEQELCSRSLASFVKFAWDHIDPEPYSHNWHMDVVCEHLEACASGEITRLLINVPPGMSKSSAAAVFFPAWLWGPGKRPHSKYIGASFAEDIAQRDNSRTRRLVKSDWFQDRWPTKIRPDQDTKTNFENYSGGFRVCSAVDSMTGKRGNFVTWDDPHSPKQTDSIVKLQSAVGTFKETLTTRLVNQKTSVITVIMQRLHEGDVSGEILSGDYGYTHVMLPMEFDPARRCYTAVKPKWRKQVPVKARYDMKFQRWYLPRTPRPHDREEVINKLPVQDVYDQDPRTEQNELMFADRFPDWVVARDKKAMGAYATAGQFDQSPTPREGAMFDTTLIEILPTCPPLKKVARGWDLAASKQATSAFSAGVLVGEDFNERTIIVDVERGQWSDAEVKVKVKNIATQDRKRFSRVRTSIPQDPGAGGKAYANSIIRNAQGLDVTKSVESGDKEMRARPVSAQCEVGNLYLVEGDWNSAFLAELKGFPTAKLKDQVDATSRGYEHMQKASSAPLTGKQK